MPSGVGVAATARRGPAPASRSAAAVVSPIAMTGVRARTPRPPLGAITRSRAATCDGANTRQAAAPATSAALPAAISGAAEAAATTR